MLPLIVGYNLKSQAFLGGHLKLFPFSDLHTRPRDCDQPAADIGASTGACSGRLHLLRLGPRKGQNGRGPPNRSDHH